MKSIISEQRKPKFKIFSFVLSNQDPNLLSPLSLLSEFRIFSLYIFNVPLFFTKAVFTVVPYGTCNVGTINVASHSFLHVFQLNGILANWQAGAIDIKFLVITYMILMTSVTQYTIPQRNLQRVMKNECEARLFSYYVCTVYTNTRM